MRPGPPPKPTRLRILEGNPGHRKINRHEPKPTPGRPACPAWLELDAKRKWRQIVPELDRIGLLTKIDGDALAGYCETYARWRHAEKARTEKGDTYKSPTGELRQRPEVGIANKELAMLTRLWQEFGLTPASRARLSVPPKTEVDELEQLLA